MLSNSPTDDCWESAFRRQLVHELSQQKSTTTRAAELQQKCNTLRHRINKWRDIQLSYMPGVTHAQALWESGQLLSTPSPSSLSTPATSSSHSISHSNGSASVTPSSNVVTSEQPDIIPLFLPSQLPESLWQSGCVPGLVEKEKRLRVAQADDALGELKRLLRISATIRDYKRVQVGGVSQKVNTRARNLLERFHQKTLRCARRYTAAYNAMCALDPGGDWSARLRFLDHAKDVRSPHRDRDEESAKGKREAEGTRQLSWIWRVQLPLRVSTEIGDSMRVEWAKSRARAMRWGEEIVLLREEMRRVIQYLDWKSRWWKELCIGRSDAHPETRRGQAAYAHKQADMFRNMGLSFAQKWYPLLLKHSMKVDWLSEYTPFV